MREQITYDFKFGGSKEIRANQQTMTIIAPTPDIMEVTLRDGSYVIDFQFTAEDTATLVSALESAGFRWIEVGHGLGLNAMDKGIRYAAASDEAHLKAAAQAARFGHKWFAPSGRIRCSFRIIGPAPKALIG